MSRRWWYRSRRVRLAAVSAVALAGVAVAWPVLRTVDRGLAVGLGWLDPAMAASWHWLFAGAVVWVCSRGAVERVRGWVSAWLGRTDGQRTAVYVWHDYAGRLLYVGVSNHPWLRVTQHVADKGWIGQANRFEIVAWYPNRQAAETAETQMIRSQAPLHNIQHNSRRRLSRVA